MVALGSPTVPLAGKLRSVLQNVESKWNVLLDSLNLKVFEPVRRTKATGIRCCLPCALQCRTHSQQRLCGRPGPGVWSLGRSILLIHRLTLLTKPDRSRVSTPD